MQSFYFLFGGEDTGLQLNRLEPVKIDHRAGLGDKLFRGQDFTPGVVFSFVEMVGEFVKQVGRKRYSLADLSAQKVANPSTGGLAKRVPHGDFNRPGDSKDEAPRTCVVLFIRAAN